MKVHVLVEKNLLKDDYEVSDGESKSAEFDVKEMTTSLISKHPLVILVELQNNRDKTLVSIEFEHYGEILTLIDHILTTLAIGDER